MNVMQMKFRILEDKLTHLFDVPSLFVSSIIFVRATPSLYR